MRKSKTTIIIALAVASALTLASCHRTPDQRAQRMVDHMASELKLDDVQKVKLEKMKDEFMARRPQMAREREAVVREANELMRSPDIDKARLNALVEKSKGHADDVIAFVAAKFTELHDMLNPEQREKLVAHIEKYMSRGSVKGENVRGPAGSGGY